METFTLALIIVAFSLIGYLWYTKMKLRNVVMELEYTVEQIHKDILEHEGLNIEDAHKGKARKRKED